MCRYIDKRIRYETISKALNVLKYSGVCNCEIEKAWIHNLGFFLELGIWPNPVITRGVPATVQKVLVREVTKNQIITQNFRSPLQRSENLLEVQPSLKIIH